MEIVGDLEERCCSLSEQVALWEWYFLRLTKDYGTSHWRCRGGQTDDKSNGPFRPSRVVLWLFDFCEYSEPPEKTSPL